MSGPVSVAIVDDYELVVAGVASVLAPFKDRVKVVELDLRVPLHSSVDVLLYDTFAQAQADQVDVAGLANGRARHVVAYSWTIDPEVVERALAAGMSGYIAKSTPPEELVELIEQVHAGERVVPSALPGPEIGAEAGAEAGAEVGNVGAWPGREYGLTDREAEILALITQGYSNIEIAGQVYLGINTIKTHIRNIYRKIQVERRPEAVLWGIDQGLRPDRGRKTTN